MPVPTHRSTYKARSPSRPKPSFDEPDRVTVHIVVESIYVYEFNFPFVKRVVDHIINRIH
jgi:hypothetical protein